MVCALLRNHASKKWHTFMVLAWTFWFSLLVCRLERVEASVFDCVDDISATVCSTIQSNGQCDSVKGRNECKKTCDFCGGWTSWSNWGDCSATKCGGQGERSRGRRCRQKISTTDCQGKSIDIQSCISNSCYKSQCGPDLFKCISFTTSSERCFPRSRICDGYRDCIGDFDEIDCKVAAGPDDDFFIASVPNDRHCLKALADGTVDFTWDCPSRSYKTVYSQLWKWWKDNNLINIETSKCLAISVSSLILKTCDSMDASQLWTCSDKSLELLDHSKTIRYISVNGNNLVATSTKPTNWQNGETNDTICDVMHGWSDWSSWSDCMPKCTELGRGELSRHRYCSNERCNGSSVETRYCDHHLCRPTCPPGFSSKYFPWSCYKFVNETASFHEANRICSTFGDGEVNYHGVLAADKNPETNTAFKQMMKEHYVSEAYIGINIQTEGVSLKEFTFSVDGQPVGMLTRRSRWHETSFGDFMNGTAEQDVPRLYLIKNEYNDQCLDIANDGEVVSVQCGKEGILWSPVNRLIYHMSSGKCLAWTDDLCSPSDVFCPTRKQYDVISKKCSFSDTFMHWDLGTTYLKPYESKIYSVTFINGDVLIDIVTHKAWLAWTESRGVQKLSKLRMDSGSWEIYMYGDSCLYALDELQVKIGDCQHNLAARWDRLSGNLIFHRKTGLCLSVADNSPLDGSKLKLQSCNQNQRIQKWRIIANADGMYSFLPWMNRRLTITDDASAAGYRILGSTIDPDLKLTSNKTRLPPPMFISKCSMRIYNDSDDATLGVLDTSKSRYWIIKKFFGSYEKFRIFNPYLGLDYCWKPKDNSCSGSKVNLIMCDDFSTSSWWMWDSLGRKLFSVSADGNNIGTCCFRAQNRNLIFPAVFQCQDKYRIEMFTTVDLSNDDEGIVMLHFPNIVFSTDQKLLYTLDTTAEQWKAIQYPGTSEMGANVLRSCQTTSGGMKYVIHEHTKSGLKCQAWNQQVPHKHSYPSLDNNFCSFPAGYESGTEKPWCLTTDATKRWEECEIPKCFDSLVVSINDDGDWKISHGESKRAFLCEASVECIEGNGENYNGTVTLAGSGNACLNWRSVEARIHGESTSSVPNHSFCRNPDADPKGPWCWTNNFVKEYCDYIQKCPIRCTAPPLSIGARIGHIEYEQGGHQYANASKIWYSCDEDRERSQPFGSEDDYDLICIDGKWIGALVACNLRYCMTPNDGVQNSFGYSNKKVLNEDTYTYKCFEGYMLSTGKSDLTLTCHGSDIWSTKGLPAENYQLDKSQLKSEELSQIACLKSCEEGYDAVSDWCVKVEHTSVRTPSHDSKVTCPPGTDQASIEVGMNPHVNPHLRKKESGKFLIDASSISSTGRSFFNKEFTSGVRDLAIPEDNFYAASFFIKTKSTFPLHGSDEYMCIYPKVSADNALDIFAMVTACPTEGNRPTEFLFRWFTARHLLNVKTQKCLEILPYANKVEWYGFMACDQNSLEQMWSCDVDALFNFHAHGYLTLSYPTSSRSEYKLIPKLYWKDSDKFVALRSHNYPEKNVCDEELKPQDKIFSVPCTKGIKDTNCDADTLNSDVACNLNLGLHISQREYDYWNTKPCKCGWIKNKATLSSGCTHVTCSSESTLTWCKPRLSAGWVHIASASKFCLASDIATGKVIEVPCEIPVTGKVCVKRTLFTCYPPKLTLENGHIKDTAHGMNVVYHPLYPVGESVFYVCDDGYLFVDGTASKEITCLNSGSWTTIVKRFECVPATCAIPSQPVNAAKIIIPEFSTQIDLGTIVNVKCDEGYVIAPGVMTLSSVCRSDGKWHPPVGSCKPNKCGEPPYVLNTVIVGTSFTLYSNITYKCIYGMHFQGSLPLVGSEHTCLEDGQWLPSPYGLTCIQTKCPDVDNIIASSGDGVDQSVTVGCSKPSEYLVGNDINTPESIKSICNASGKWVPPVTGLNCMRPLCDKGKNITNADFTGYHPFQTQGKLQYATAAKYSCIEGYASAPQFMIYSSVSRGTCLRTIELEKVFRIRLISECENSISATMLWRWWPRNNNLLQHVESGLCLMHSITDEVHQGGVYLAICDRYERNQMWDCQNINGKHYIATNNNIGETALYLKHNVGQKGLHLSDTFDTYGTQWIGKDVQDLCDYRTRQRNFQLICSADGSWIPKDTDSICFTVKCKVPDGFKGTSYSGHGDLAEVPVGTKISAVCEQGYEMANGLKTQSLYCSGDPTWVPDITTIKCQPVSCGEAPVFIGATSSSGTLGNLYMSEKIVTCEDGLWFEELKLSQLKISCGRDGTWSFPQGHSVLCSPIRCPSDYAAPENAFLLAGNIPSNHYGSKIKVSCREGYWFETFLRVATLFCGSDGTWIPNDISCSRSYCVMPSEVTSYANLISKVPEKSPLSFKATYECREYTHVQGSKFFDVYCAEDGSWNPNPRTVICRHETCINPHIWKLNYDINADMLGNGTDIGDVVTIRCHKGYVYSDSTTTKMSRCGGREGWNPSLEVIKCQRRSCPLSTAVPNMVIQPVTGFRYGDFANVTCSVGFTLTLRTLKHMTVVCSSQGVWMPYISSLQCSAIQCKVPSLVSTIVFELNPQGRTTVGSSATLSCIDGYVSSTGLQKRQLTCNGFGEWVPTISQFQCVENSCEEGEEFQPQCPQSFWIPPTNTVKTQPFCNPSVASIQESPCTPVTCVDLPVVSYADISHHVPGTFGSLAVGAKVRYKCRENYHFHHLFETMTDVSCTSSGMWSPDPFQLECTAISCKTPSNAVNDVLDHQVGDTIDVSCKRGYQLPENMETVTLSCTTDGKWSPYHENGPCQSIDCGKPMQIAFSRAEVTDTHLASKAHYRCYEGYKAGLTMYSWFATCNENGVWQPTDLQCIPDDKFFCDVPKSMPNSKRYLPSTYLKGEEVTYMCDQGHRTADGKESVVVRCGATRSWIPDIDIHAVCALVTCPYPSGFKFSLHHVTSPEPIQQYFTVGQEIETSCELGYFTTSNATAITSVCQINGTWSPNPVEIVCTGTTCKSLVKIAHSTVRKFVLGTIKYGAVYTCDAGYTFRPKSSSASRFFLTICHFVDWFPTPIGKFCLPILCKNAPSIKNAILVGSSVSYGSVITVNCLPGYKFSDGRDEVKLVCKEGGAWNTPSNLLECKVIDCGNPISIVGAKVTYTTTRFRGGATYTCDSGMTGMMMTVRCGATGRWEPLPSNVVKCENVFCPAPPYIRNAISLYGNTRSGGSWHYRCKSGFQVIAGVDKFYILCNSIGKWNTKSPCRQIACGKPPDIPSAYLAEHNMTRLDDGTLDQKAKYKCKAGAWFSNGLQKALDYTITCANGNWHPDPHSKLRCVPITCPVPLRQNSKSYTTSGISKGDTMHFKSTIRYQCPKGYYFRKYARNAITISCTASGAWSRSNLQLDCEPVFCNVIVGDPHADWADNVNPQIGAQLNVTCHPNYWYYTQVFSMVKTCDQNGRWMPYEKCTRISCPEPTSDRIDFELAAEGFFYVGSHKAGSILRLSCKEGYYQLTNFDHLRCESNGYWVPNPNSVLCNPHTCTTLATDLPNGKVFGSNLYNETMSLQCDSEYMISPGVTTISSLCRADKTWTVDLREYQCQPIECTFDSNDLDPDLTIPLPALKYGYGDIVKVVCRNGFSFEDGMVTKSAVCSVDAKFHPVLEELNCDSVKCPLPEKLGSANLIYENQGVGSNLTVRCQPFHWIARYSKNTWMLTPIRSVSVVCTKYGTWSFKDENFKCLNIDQLSIHGQKVGLYQILYMPGSQSNWLTFDGRYAITAFKSEMPMSNNQDQADGVVQGRETQIVGGRSMRSNETKSQASNLSLHENERVLRGRQMNNGQSNSAIRAFSSALSYPSDTVSSNITYLWDGDSRTLWAPHLDDKEWRFQLHLGSPFVIEEFMLMGDVDGTISLIFATHDGSLPEKVYDPISAHNEVQNDVISKQTTLNGYGAMVILSGFDYYPTTIIQVKFSKPPHLREIGIKASPAKAIVVSSSTVSSALLSIPITLFLVFIIVSYLADRYWNKTYQLTWRFAGFTIQYRTKQLPGSNPALFFEVLPIMESAHLNARSKRERENLYFECTPELKHLQIKFTLVTCKRCPREKNSLKPWDFHNIKVAYNGTVWTSMQKCFLEPDSTKFILLKQPQLSSDYQTDGLVTFFKQHSLAFLCPIADLNYQVNSYVSSLVNLSTALLVTFAIAVVCQLHWGSVADTSVLARFSWYEVVVRDLVLSFAIGASFGTICLLLLRMHYIGFPFLKDVIKSTVANENSESSHSSKLALSNKSSETSRCSHMDSNEDGTEKSTILSVYSQSQTAVNPSAGVPEPNEFTLTKQILKKDMQWRKYLIPVTVSALAIAVIAAVLSNDPLRESVPAVHAAIGACMLLLLIGTLVENMLVTVLFNAAQTKRMKSWSMKCINDLPRKKQRAQQKMAEGKWVRKSSHSRYRQDQSNSEFGLPIAVQEFTTSSEIDLLLEIEERIHDTPVYSPPENQCNVTKLPHMIEYTRCGMDFDFITNVDVDLYVKYQKENVLFEEIEEALRKSSSGENWLYSSEREQWNQREWTDWTVVGNTEVTSSQKSESITTTPKIVNGTNLAYDKYPTPTLEDMSETAKNSTLLAKLEKKIEKLERKIDVNVTSDKEVGTSRSAALLAQRLQSKVKPSMVKLPKSLVNEILQYSAGGKVTKIQPTKRMRKDKMEDPLSSSDYKVTKLHPAKVTRKDKMEDPSNLSAYDNMAGGRIKDAGPSSDLCGKSSLGNVATSAQVRAWDEERNSVISDPLNNPSTSGDSLMQLSRKPSQTMSSGSVGSSTVDSTLSSLEGLQSLKNAFVDIREILARDFSDVIKD